METTWVLVANSSEAKLFSSKNISKEIALEQSFENPENRLKVHDMVDAPHGSYKTRGNLGQGAYADPTDPRQNEIAVFAKKIAHYLEHGRTNHSYHRLVLIAPSHFQGLLNHELNDHIKKSVIATVEHDYTHLPQKELLNHLEQLPKY
jgi:protein required for attachment to host cells